MKKYIVGVGIFALILLSISLWKIKNNEEGSIAEKNTLYFTQYISDRIGLHLDLNNLEIWDCSDLFMD